MLLGWSCDDKELDRKRADFIWDTYRYETEDTRKQAEKSVYERYSKTTSVAMRGILQLGLRLAVMLNPRMTHRFLNMNIELTKDDCFYLSDFLPIIEEMENDPFFKEKENDLTKAIQYAIQNEQQISGSLFFSNVFLAYVSENKRIESSVTMKPEMQQLYIDEIHKHNERNVINYYLADQRLITEPLCQFFRKFNHPSTTMGLKRQAFINLARCIFNASEPSKLPEILNHIEFPSEQGQISQPTQALKV